MASTVPCINSAHGVKNHKAGSAAAIECAASTGVKVHASRPGTLIPSSIIKSTAPSISEDPEGSRAHIEGYLRDNGLRSWKTNEVQFTVQVAPNIAFDTGEGFHRADFIELRGKGDDEEWYDADRSQVRFAANVTGVEKDEDNAHVAAESLLRFAREWQDKFGENAIIKDEVTISKQEDLTRLSPDQVASLVTGRALFNNISGKSVRLRILEDSNDRALVYATSDHHGTRIPGAEWYIPDVDLDGDLTTRWDQDGKSVNVVQVDGNAVKKGDSFQDVDDHDWTILYVDKREWYTMVNAEDPNGNARLHRFENDDEIEMIRD